MNFILFNGPPRSGKDTAAKIVCDHLLKPGKLWPVWEKFSFPNKRAFAGTVHTAMDDEGNVRGYEHRKGEPLPILNGASFRQWQIDYSEKFMKPLYGNDIFGRLLLARCDEENVHDIYVVSDCGFQIECDVLRNHNVLLIRMEREGCTFEGDSREYVAPHPGWPFLVCFNNGTLDDLRAVLTTEVDAWLSHL